MAYDVRLTGKLKNGVDIFGQMPERPDRPQMLAMFANTETERKLLKAYLDESFPDARPPVAWFSESENCDALQHEGMVDALAQSETLDIIPIGVVWKPKSNEQQGWREIASWMRLVDSNSKQRSILRKTPERSGIVIAEFGTRKALQARYDKMSGNNLPPAKTDLNALADFVALQAAITIERDSRVATGDTIKYPRHVISSIWGRPIFQAQLAEIAEASGRDLEEVRTEARECLQELIPKVRAPHVSASTSFMRFLCRLGYDQKLVFDEERMKQIRQLTLNRPTALVWTHKTHVDGPAMIAASRDANFPLVHLVGGANMAFFGIGYLMSRAGTIFIRRKIDSDVYKVVLRFYISWLLEKRFPVSWALEGTRSRNGKLMPPRFGILKYVVEAAAKENMTDLTIVPVSIYYDLIAELGDYATEQTGAVKRKESISWFIGYMRSLRKPLGRISLGMGDPVTVDTTDPAFNDAFEAGDESFSIALQKLAFDASVKANEVTPLTPSSIFALVLTGAEPRALTEEECRIGLREILDWAEKRGIPVTDELKDYQPEKIRDVIAAMVEIGVVERFDGETENLYSIADDKHFEASYYRNNSIHFFVNKAIVELALVKASEAGAAQAVTAFWDEVIYLRDTFKFEFFYPELEVYKEEIAQEVALFEPSWLSRLAGGGAMELLKTMRPLVAHAVLRPFAEAYTIVADVILDEEGTSVLEEKAVVESALKRGKQAFLQRRITSEESIGKLMFSNGYQLAANRGLVPGGTSDIKAARQAFVRELGDLAQRLRVIGEIAAAPRSDDDPTSRATILNVVGKD